MDKDKFIIWLKLTCGELDGLAQTSDDEVSNFYTGQLCFAERLLDFIENGFFEKEN